MKKIFFVLLLLSPLFGLSQVKYDSSKGRNYVEVNPVMVNEVLVERFYCLGITKDSLGEGNRKIYLSWSLNDNTGSVSALVGSATMDVSGVATPLQNMNVVQTVYMFDFIIKNDSVLKESVIIK